MKNYKSLLFVAASIITTNNNHITQTDDSILSPQSECANYLSQLENNLKNIPESDSSAIKTMTQQELTQQKSVNDDEKIKIIKKAIIDRVTTNTRTIVSRLTNNQTEADNTVQSMSNKVKELLEQNDNLKLKQFFGLSLEYMVQQDVSDFKKEQAAKFALSVPKKSE